MGKEHRLAERRQAILAELEQAGQLSVAELSARFEVSEVTIRTDLQALSEQNLLLRTRGGALATNVLPELSFDVRQQQQAEKKARIGQAAAQMVGDGDTIALDASTSAIAVISYLKNISELTVITNSLKAAMSLLRLPRVHVIMPGGSLRRDSISLVNPSLDAGALKDINVRTGFFGARGITPRHGLTDVNIGEVQMKRWLVECCRHTVGLVDARKWGQVATTTFAHPEQIDTIITDDGAPAELVAEMQALGVEVIVV